MELWFFFQTVIWLVNPNNNNTWYWNFYEKLVRRNKEIELFSIYVLISAAVKVYLQTKIIRSSNQKLTSFQAYPFNNILSYVFKSQSILVIYIYIYICITHTSSQITLLGWLEDAWWYMDLIISFKNNLQHWT